jgi:hypothetical protein
VYTFGVMAAAEGSPPYISVQDVDDDVPIGSGPLTIFEEADMAAAGLGRGDVAALTPQQLREQANAAVESSTLFIGS